jgi:hypothetical protein
MTVHLLRAAQSNLLFVPEILVRGLIRRLAGEIVSFRSQS